MSDLLAYTEIQGFLNFVCFETQGKAVTSDELGILLEEYFSEEGE